jgi:HEAT repeat protein
MAGPGAARNWRRVIGLASVVALLVLDGGTVAGQPGTAWPPTPEQLDELLRREDRDALPAVREVFRRASDKAVRLRAAATLVRLGDPEMGYWEFLVREASRAVDSDMPDPLPYDAQGRGIKGRFSQEFLDWCGARKVDCQAAAEEAMMWLPSYVLVLGTTGDPRGFDILMRGIASKNSLIVAQAARALARLQDRRAIGPIIDAARRVPADMRLVVASALVFFDDPEARKAAEELIPDRAVLDTLRKQARKGPKAVYEY